jgi:hypothetical protein
MNTRSSMSRAAKNPLWQTRSSPQAQCNRPLKHIKAWAPAEFAACEQVFRIFCQTSAPFRSELSHLMAILPMTRSRAIRVPHDGPRVLVNLDIKSALIDL